MLRTKKNEIMIDDPYKNIPSLDIEIGGGAVVKPKASILLLVLAILFVALNFIVNLLFNLEPAPEYMNNTAKAGYLEGKLYGPLFIPIVLLAITQLFRVCRNNRARVKIMFWVSLFFFLGGVGQLFQSGA